MDVKFTSIYQKVNEGCIGFVEELPGANARGEPLKKLVKIYRKRWS
jgi:hypothetical protein